MINEHDNALLELSNGIIELRKRVECANYTIGFDYEEEEFTDVKRLLKIAGNIIDRMCTEIER